MSCILYIGSNVQAKSKFMASSVYFRKQKIMKIKSLAQGLQKSNDDNSTTQAAGKCILRRA
jgi:hypothetical protein